MGHMGETVEAIGYKTDVKTRTKAKVSGTIESVKSKVGGAGARVNEATPGREDVKQGGRQAVSIAQNNPIGLALGSVALGFVAGTLLPSTRVEDEKLDARRGREARRGLRPAHREDQGDGAGGRRARQAGRARGRAERQGSARESGQEHAEQLKQTAQQKAEETKQTAGS